MVGPTDSLGLGMAALYRMMAPVMFTLHDGETHSQCQSDEWFSVLSRRTTVFFKGYPSLPPSLFLPSYCRCCCCRLHVTAPWLLHYLLDASVVLEASISLPVFR